MHETALVRDVVHRMVELTQSAGACRVSGARIWLGALSHLSPEHFRDHFSVEAQGTVAAGAVLTIEMSDDPNDPHAQLVRLESIDLDDDE